ncbi:MAG: flagellar M-ring protein FliF [Gammaproteobacteria bacterium]|nr:flagellar M-ring protein FliF [Gammaproteobacteria bacterium]
MAVLEPTKAFAQFDVVSQLPMLRQLGLLVGLAASIALGVYIVIWAQEPVYAPLYGDLSEMDASQVINQLEQSNTPYKYDAGSGVISVAANDIHEVRIRMASSGLPSSSDRGLAMLHDDQSIGTSAFIEGARYNQAVAEELQRSIASLNIVKAARVHLAIPQKSAFIRNRSEANASVVVSLASGRSLSESQIAGIVYLVASSVSDLDPENVTLIDQRGRLLSGQGGSEEMQMSNEQLRYAHQIENSLTERVVRMLAPLYGEDNVRVQVTAAIDHTAEERTVEQYGQQEPVLRSEQISEDTSNEAQAAGVPGALVPTPPNAGQEGELGGAQQAGNTSRRSTRNYEVDRTISHIKAAGGQIQRLSVAVVLNYKAQEVDAPPPVPGEEAPEAAEATMEMLPVTPEEIAQVEQIVREAVGIDAGRGDSVSISSAQFQTFVPAPIEEPEFMDSLSDYTGAAKMAGGFIAIMALIFGVLRPMLRSLVSASAEAVIANAQPRYVNPEGQAYDAQGQPMALQDGGQYPAQVGGPNGVAGSSMPRQSYDQQLGRARAMVQEDPERVAGVLKDWVAADA